MTVYIVHLHYYSGINGVYTDLAIAQQNCNECIAKEKYKHWIITPIELTTDSFMESVLTNKDSK